MSQAIANALLEASRTLRKAGIPEPRREAGSLLADLLGQDRTFLITHAEVILTVEQSAEFQQRVDRRAAGEPLQYITGIQEFFGLSFAVNHDALIPRPETELLIETSLGLIVGAAAEPLICDVGTGTGCISIVLLHERPRARAVAIDLSPSAVRLAKKNAVTHSVSERLSLVVADSFSAFDTEPRFDLIVSNPPYIADPAWKDLQREVRDHEPRVALTSGADGLDMIRRLIADAPAFLVKGGHFVFEIGFDQRALVEALIDLRIWTLLAMHDDLQGIPRTVVLQKL
jgi:release factor glutamine methyltransferase